MCTTTVNACRDLLNNTCIVSDNLVLVLKIQKLLYGKIIVTPPELHTEEVKSAYTLFQFEFKKK